MATIDEMLQSILKELKNLSIRMTDTEFRLAELEGKPRPEKIVTAKLPPQLTPVAQPAAETKQPATAPAGTEFETKIGVEWLGKIGIVAIAIAMAYLLTYTIDNPLFGLTIGPIGRILIGFIVAIAMLLFGEFFTSQYPQWSKEFTGGGLGLLYFAIFAASNWEKTPFIPYSAGLVLMALISTAAMWFSIRYNAKIIAYFGLLGAYLAPVMVGYSLPSYNRMLFYILVLDIAVLFFSFFRKWRVLNAIAFTATLIYSLSAYYGGGLSFILAVSYVIIFFCVFITIPILYNLMNRERTEQADMFILIANPLLTIGSLYALCNAFDYGNYMGLISLIMAAIYLVLAYAAFSVNREDKFLSLSFVGLTAGFVALAIPLQLHTHWITVAWAMQFITMLWIGLQLRQYGTRLYALIVGIFALIRLFAIDIVQSSGSYGRIFWNPRVFTALFVIALIYIGAYLYKHYRATLVGEEKNLIAALAVIANVLTVYLISNEIYLRDTIVARAASLTQSGALSATFTPLGFRVHLIISTFLLAYATVLILIGIIKKYKSIRILALVLYLFAILKIVIFDLSGFEAIYRIIAFIILGVALIFASYMYTRNKEKILNFIREERPDEKVTSSILSMSDQGKKEVIFTLLDGRRFKVANQNVVKICLAVQTKSGKSEFHPHELQDIYLYYEKNFRSQLNEVDLGMIKKYLLDFVVTGGSFEFN